jgi:transglutaminase/protease-like cytokinesis protein 3
MFRLMWRLCILVSMYSFCGYNLQGQNLEAADRFAFGYEKTVRSLGDVDTLIKHINQAFTTPLDKSRAFFTWVARNLQYDCGEDGNPLRTASLEQVLLTGKSQCSGYASLLQYGLRKLGLEAVTIRGVAKTAKKDLWWTEKDLVPNHAWNAVNIGGRWVLLDPTWASGASDADCKVIDRSFAPFYFDPKPEQFILSHLPADTQWQLLASKMNRETFLQQPVYHDPFYSHKISRISPDKGVLKVKQGETIQFSFISAMNLDSAAIWCEERKDVKPVFGKFTRNGNQYTFAYKVQVMGQYFLNVSLDGRNTALVFDLTVNN